jgi:hypothetical protein
VARTPSLPGAERAPGNALQHATAGFTVIDAPPLKSADDPLALPTTLNLAFLATNALRLIDRRTTSTDIPFIAKQEPHL